MDMRELNMRVTILEERLAQMEQEHEAVLVKLMTAFEKTAKAIKPKKKEHK